jgi:phosphatidylserine/phosphatidylglycerophosphate/cardiolipin synthase-like enzyme
LRMVPLGKNWNASLRSIFQAATRELIIASPYVSTAGVKFVLDSVSAQFKQQGKLTFLTNLSAQNIVQSSTDPSAFKLLCASLHNTHIIHLPRLHAKVYIGDSAHAIITSGNLTQGGIHHNFEYGAMTDDISIISTMRGDILDYGKLGATLGTAMIDTYCDLADTIRALYKESRTSNTRLARRLDDAMKKADDTLITATVKSTRTHPIFEQTILYILRTHGTLHTASINDWIAHIHPDLCDDSIERVINGVSFGKKWKHAVRTAQQHLKKKGLIALLNGKWTLI